MFRAHLQRMEAVRVIIFLACSIVGSLIIGSILFAIPGAWQLITGIIVFGYIVGIVIQSVRLILGD